MRVLGSLFIFFGFSGFLVVALWLALDNEQSANKVRDGRSNIVIIVTDDHGYGDLGAYGYSDDIRTPNLDWLATNGALMTHGYVTAPQCVPSRAGIVTGRYQTRFGVDSNEFVPIPANEVTVAERMRNAGYVTGFVGKWHLEPSHEGIEWLQEYWPEGMNRKRPFTIPEALRRPYKPMSKGFTDFYDGSWKHYFRNYDLDGHDVWPARGFRLKSQFRIDHQTEAAIAFLERRKDEPFFLQLSYFAPHVPMEYTKKYFDRFPGDMPERRRWGLASISAIDDGVGEIVQTLEKHGLADNTIIFFFGDNGAPLQIERRDDPFSVKGGWDGSDNGPLVGEKGMLSEGGIRVPYIVYWKNRIAPQVYENPVISLDAGATALTLAGVKTSSSEIDGVNLLPYLTKDEMSEPHDALYWRFWGQSAIRMGKWKLIVLETGRKLLFDMTSDAHENQNLVDQHPEIANQLESRLADWREGQRRQGFTARYGREAPWFDYYFGEE